MLIKCNVPLWCSTIWLKLFQHYLMHMPGFIFKYAFFVGHSIQLKMYNLEAFQAFQAVIPPWSPFVRTFCFILACFKYYQRFLPFEPSGNALTHRNTTPSVFSCTYCSTLWRLPPRPLSSPSLLRDPFRLCSPSKHCSPSQRLSSSRGLKNSPGLL